MPHASHNQRNVETERIATPDDDTDELPATDKVGSTTAIVRSINLMKKPMTISLSLVTIIAGGGWWLWLLHQRTDSIPVIKSQLDAMQSDVTTIKNILIQKALSP